MHRKLSLVAEQRLLHSEVLAKLKNVLINSPSPCMAIGPLAASMADAEDNSIVVTMGVVWQEKGERNNDTIS